MKVVVTPPGDETQWPLAIRLIMHLPIPKYKRWRLRDKAISRLKPMLMSLYNLPKQMPTDFELKYDHRVFKFRETKRIMVSFGNELRMKQVVLNSELNKLPNMDAVPESTGTLSIDQRQTLYSAIRKLGFIHFESHDNIEVSYDFVVQTEYKLVVEGREYYYAWSTTDPTRSEWSEEEFELDGLINKIAGDSSVTKPAT